MYIVQYIVMTEMPLFVFLFLYDFLLFVDFNLEYKIYFITVISTF